MEKCQCKCSTSENKGRNTSSIKVHQFIKEGNQKLYPKTILNAVEDYCSGLTLDVLLKQQNNRFTKFKEDIEARVLSLETTGLPKSEITLPDNLEDRISALEAREDKDTIFDPSSLLDSIRELKEEVKTLKAELAKKQEDVRVVSGEWLNESSFRLFLSNGEHVDVTGFSGEIGDTRLPIYYGYYETTTEGDLAKIEDLVHQMKSFEMPITLEWGETKEDVFGYFGVAIPKNLAPTINRVEMRANGSYNELLPGGYNLIDTEIDGEPYWFIQDKDINQIDPIGLKIY